MQFQKFSRGEFPNRAMVRIKNSKNKFNIATTAEYARELVINIAEKLGEEKTQVTGALISALRLDDAFEYKERKSAIGINKYLIDKEMSGNEIIDLCEKAKKAFIGLSFKTEDYDLKIQAKSPKSAKGAGNQKKEDKKTKIDFCKLKTTDKDIVRNLLFDEELKELNFKEVEIKHDFIINEIVIPDELKNEKDFAKVREMSRRKGKIIRRINVDDREVVKEVEFEA